MRTKMKLKSPPPVLFASLCALFGGIVLLPVACNRPADNVPAGMADNSESKNAAAPAPCCPIDKKEGETKTTAPLPDDSIYQLPGIWKTQRGETITLADLAGKARVMTFGFTHCEHVCPRLVADLKRFRDTLIAQGRRDVGWVFVSIDPERDDPETLRAFADRLDANSPNWTYLTAPDEQVRELTALLGVRYKKNPDGNFSHSNSYIAFDSKGRAVHETHSVADNPEEFAGKIPK